MKRIENKENKADPQPCIQNVPECFLEAPANLKLFEVLTSLENRNSYHHINSTASQFLIIPIKIIIKSQQFNSMFESQRPPMQISTQHLNLQVTTANYKWGHV